MHHTGLGKGAVLEPSGLSTTFRCKPPRGGHAESGSTGLDLKAHPHMLTWHLNHNGIGPASLSIVVDLKSRRGSGETEAILVRMAGHLMQRSDKPQRVGRLARRYTQVHQTYQT